MQYELFRTHVVRLHKLKSRKNNDITAKRILLIYLGICCASWTFSI